MPTPEELAAKKAADDAAAKAVADAAKKAEDDAAKKAADDQIAGIMKDPEAVHALLKSKRDANEEAKGLRLKLEGIEKAQKAADDKALLEQGKFKELAEKAKGENETMRASYTNQLVNLYLKIEAQAAGSVDADAVVALANRAAIKVSDTFEVTGAGEAVEELKKSKAYLFGKVDTKVAPVKGGVPAPRGGFGIVAGDENLSPRDKIARGLEGKK